ncbi:MAG: metal-dependent transcriptional regulator [Chloroflexota bacterium]
METTLTQSIQDYLKHIYELTEDGGAASTNDLAARLNIKPASVTGMIQKLASAQPALVEYFKHQGVTLTPEGQRAALEVIRHHRLLETYLVTKLGYTWDEVHDEACRLEHVISEDFEQRIAEALGHPERDPHGDPIPNADLRMPSDASRLLSDLRPPSTVTIRRVGQADTALLRHLDGLGLRPEARLEILDYSNFDKTMHLRLDASGEKLVLGQAITDQIFVEETV